MGARYVSLMRGCEFLIGLSVLMKLASGWFEVVPAGGFYLTMLGKALLLGLGAVGCFGGYLLALRSPELLTRTRFVVFVALLAVFGLSGWPVALAALGLVVCGVIVAVRARRPRGAWLVIATTILVSCVVASAAFAAFQSGLVTRLPDAVSPAGTWVMHSEFHADILDPGVALVTVEPRHFPLAGKTIYAENADDTVGAEWLDDRTVSVDKAYPVMEGTVTDRLLALLASAPDRR